MSRQTWKSPACKHEGDSDRARELDRKQLFVSGFSTYHDEDNHVNTPRQKEIFKEDENDTL